MTPKYPSSISGYTVLPLQFPPVPSFPHAAQHFLYLQPHDPRVPDEDSPRSLFLVNVPIATTETHLRHLFGRQLSGGRVERVQFYDAPQQEKATVAAIEGKPTTHKSKKRKRETAEDIQAKIESSASLPPQWDRELHTSGSHAVVVFVDRTSMESSLKAAKAAAKSKKIIIWGEGIEDKIPSLGAARYQTHQQLRYPAKADLLRSVNNYMNLFSRLEETRAREVARGAQEPDDDGFVTVTRGPKNNAIRQEELADLAEKQKEKSKGLDDFYRFQTREKRKERQGELLKQFEEDKKRVEDMKMRRGKMRLE